ncbi:unnamed protein product, partial [marine sediment metagenome]
VLLCALTLLLVSAPVAHALGAGARPVAQIVIAALFSAMLLSAVFQVSRSRVAQIIGLTLAGPVLVLQWINAWLEMDRIAVANHVLAILFLGYVVIVIVKLLFTSTRATSDTICASACAYLVLGVLWAVVYSLVQILDPASFAFALAEEGQVGSMRFGTERSVFAIYYSFVTMSTLGYGDIVPASGSARMLAAVQAVMGQLYIAVLVARLVGLHISQSATRR